MPATRSRSPTPPIRSRRIYSAPTASSSPPLNPLSQILQIRRFGPCISSPIYPRRMVWLLDHHWEKQHRSYAMSVEQRDLAPLKLRSHGVNLGWMRYDERYTPYVRETGLLPFIQLVSRLTPPNNAPAVTTLIDHWRLETHSFHLRTGEMTVMLQDIVMITGLPIDGNPLCMSIDSDGWREQMHALIDMVPPEPRESEVEGKKKERVAAGAPFTCIPKPTLCLPSNSTISLGSIQFKSFLTCCKSSA